MRFKDMITLGTQRLGQDVREAVYLRTGLDATRPIAIQALPTERCNYRCLSCKCWRQDSYPDEMTLDEWTAALGDLRRFIGPYAVQFAGGEPFVFKPFLDLVEWCAAHGVGWGVITNGSALNEANARRVAGAAPINIDVSVDGATAAVHDASRGMPGSLARVARGVAALREARDRIGASFAIRIKPTVHRLNLHEMPAMVEWAVKAGATTIDFSPVRPWTEEVERDLWLRPEDEPALQRVVQALLEAQRAGAPIETEPSRLACWPAHFRGETVRPSIAPCRVGLRDFHILANGDVRTCWHYPPIGNVRRAPAREIWHGAFARAQRATMMRCPSFGSPVCATSCLAHRTLAQDIRRVVIMRRHAHAPAGSDYRSTPPT